MATDVDVQYFSHLNGLTLGNNWGDLIRLLDKALVTGIDFTKITAASINAQGDVHISLYSAHNAMLFQVVELTGFMPVSLNQKYRIKGVPNTTELILKPKTDIVERSINTTGAGKLASLGYEIIFRDTNDVKRVYRAKNPTAQHPFIRVDETISDGVNSYTSTYAKSAMVGLLENMTHIDDYQNPDVLQLPFDPSDPAKNWKIIGTGMAVVRGWSRWYWGRTGTVLGVNSADSAAPAAGDRQFTLVGDADAFYLCRGMNAVNDTKAICGTGLFRSTLNSQIIPNWFLSSVVTSNAASVSMGVTNLDGGSLFASTTATRAMVMVPKYTSSMSPQNHLQAQGVLPDAATGSSGVYSSNEVSALEIPIYDTDKYLRGTMPHILYNGNNASSIATTTPKLSETSMYVLDRIATQSGNGGFYFYLGELE